MTRSLPGFPIPKENSAATWRESPRMSCWLPTGRPLVSLPNAFYVKLLFPGKKVNVMVDGEMKTYKSE